MAPNQTLPELFERLSQQVSKLAKPFSGQGFRFVDPRFSKVSEQFAGKGSLFANGRWSLASREYLVVYTSLEPETALAESLSSVRYYGFPDSKATPLVLVTASAQLGKIIDLRDGKVRQRLRISERVICETDWRLENAQGCQSITQAWGQAMAEVGIEAFITPSAAWRGGSNLVIFPANFSRETRLSVTSEVKWPRL